MIVQCNVASLATGGALIACARARKPRVELQEHRVTKRNGETDGESCKSNGSMEVHSVKEARTRIGAVRSKQSNEKRVKSTEGLKECVGPRDMGTGHGQCLAVSAEGTVRTASSHAPGRRATAPSEGGARVS